MVKFSRSAGGVVVNKKGEVLAVSQNYGTSWSFPKGHIEVGESALVAAKREIYEESGVKELTLIKELGSYERTNISRDGKGEDKSKISSITLFLFKTNQEKLKPVDPQNPEARWVGKEGVVNLLTHKKDKEFFLSIIDIVKQQSFADL